jgi:hypothetical protein
MHDRFNGTEENGFADYQIALGLLRLLLQPYAKPPTRIVIQKENSGLFEG